MSGAEVIASYERILALMHEMHNAAARGAWEDLATIETQCRNVAQTLIAQESSIVLAPVESQRKSVLIRQTLTVDAAIRALTDPWLARLQGFLGTRERERKLHQAYGAPEGR